MECHARNVIQPQDTVIIMWTSAAREDRWCHGDWLTPGNIYSQHDYPESWVREFADDRWYLMRDLATISATREILEHWGCRWIFTSMMPLTDISENDDHNTNNHREVADLYRSVLGSIRPSVLESVFQGDWASRPVSETNQSLARLRLRDLYDRLRGSDWPQWEEFESDIVPKDSSIWQEMKKLGLFQKKRRLVRGDGHPTPLEHLEYVHAVMPEFQLDLDTVNWVKHMEELVQTNKPCEWSQHRPLRFA